MISLLDRKLLRDLNRMKGQAVAVALVMACGLAVMTMARSLIYSLENTRAVYYQENRFAEIFASLKRAPLALVDRVSAIPGVAGVEPGIAAGVTLDIPELDEPASGMVRSLPDYGTKELNRLFLRAGRWIEPGSRNEVLVSEAFAEANQLQPGHPIVMVLNGQRQIFRIAGIVLSPEYIFESRPGAALPDNRTYGIFWMKYEQVSKAFDLYGAFNQLSLALAPGASERHVITALDQLLQPYGGRGAYSRIDHASHIRVSDEIRILTTLSIGFPIVFLSVAAFMTNAVLSRLLSLQREQIAILKAFGFANRQIVVHYLKFSFVMVSVGTALGTLGGVLLGQRMVIMYKAFFRFPSLPFTLDKSALAWAVIVGCSAAVLGVYSSVRRAARLPPAEAMRPEPPASYKPALVERTGIGHFLSHTFRIAIRNIERHPMQALFTVTGLALATGILILPNCFRDSVKQVLGIQWDIIDREDVRVGLVEPRNRSVESSLYQLPGVMNVESFRGAAARIKFNNKSRQLALRGLPRGGLQSRVVDENMKEVQLSKDGLVISAKLAEVLETKVGDQVQIEMLEGKRRILTAPIVGLAQDLVGISAYMELEGLNRFLQEGDIISGASMTIDPKYRSDFLRALKEVPGVGWVAIKESLRENFRRTTAASINLFQSIYLVFATVVAFGVVYNNARISLAERGRELATLRVIGFSQREVGSVLLTELVILALIALPLGLLLGTGFSVGIVGLVNTETVRLPLVLSTSNYAFATSVVALASIVSALMVLRRLKQLNLVSALKAPE